MITYRGYTIVPHYNYVNGKMDGAIFSEEAEQGSAFFYHTLSEVKREIDSVLLMETHYRVIHTIPHAGRVITKFTWLTDHNGEMGALSFASKVNGEIEMYIGGFQEELTFN